MILNETTKEQKMKLFRSRTPIEQTIDFLINAPNWMTGLGGGLLGWVAGRTHLIYKSVKADRTAKANADREAHEAGV
jgi:lysine/ornithine N-monooxygenase